MAVPLPFPFSHHSTAAPGFVCLSCYGEAVAARPCWGAASCWSLSPGEWLCDSPKPGFLPVPLSARSSASWCSEASAHHPFPQSIFCPFSRAVVAGEKVVGLPLAKSAAHPMKSLSPPHNSWKSVHMASDQPGYPGKHPGPNSVASGCECAGTVTLQSQGKQNRELYMSSCPPPHTQDRLGAQHSSQHVPRSSASSAGW